MRDIEEIVALCERNAYAELSADDIIRALAWVRERLLTDIYHDMAEWPSPEDAQRTFESVTDVLMTCLDAISERTEPTCHLTTAYCYHDLAESGRELWWSVPSETGDEFIDWHGQEVRLKGRGPWLTLAASMSDVAAAEFSELPRTIPSIERRLVFDPDTKQKWGIQSRTHEKCAIRKSELPETLHPAFDRYAAAQHVPTDATIYVALPEGPSEMPTETQTIEALVDFGISEDFAVEMAHETFSGEIPVKLAMMEMGASSLEPISLKKTQDRR